MKMTVRKAAELAGVSPATVSRVLNGAPGMSDATRERVLKVLGGAVTPRRAHPAEGGNIALLMPRRRLYGRTFFLRLTKILQIFGSKWSLILLPENLTAAEFKRQVLRQKIAGVIICGFQLSSQELTEAAEQLPHVWINSHTAGKKDSAVLMGNEQSGRIAARYLLDFGCKNCAVIELPSENPGNPARCDGFRFECFTRQCRCNEVRLQTPLLETLSQRELEKIFADAAKQGNFRSYDGLFVPECYLLPALHLALHQHQSNLEFPRIVCGNASDDLLAGLSPKPAVIDAGEELLTELACQELFRRISGDTLSGERSAVFISPKLLFC